MKKLFVLSLVMVFLSVGSVNARMQINEGEVQEAQKIKKKKYWFKRELADFKVTGNPKHVPENTKVIVPYFRVTFAKGGKYLNSVGGITTSKTKVISSLNGVDEETMQAVTDSIYEDLIAQLKEAGYQVQDVSTLDDNKTYQKLSAKSKYPVIKKNTAQFTPGNRYYPGTVAVKAFMLARDLDALMLKADFTVNFILVNANKKKFNVLKDKSDVKVSQGINVFGELAVITEKGPVSFLIQQPIVSEMTFGTVEDSTKTSDKVGDGVKMVASWVGGGGLGNRSSTNRVDVTADLEQYKLAAQDALAEANAVLTAFMQEKITEE